MKLSFDGGDFVMEEYKVGYGGIWRNLHMAGVWSQSLGFVLAR
jgi:hypothetical protein